MEIDGMEDFLFFLFFFQISRRSLLSYWPVYNWNVLFGCSVRYCGYKLKYKKKKKKTTTTFRNSDAGAGCRMPSARSGVRCIRGSEAIRWIAPQYNPNHGHGACCTSKLLCDWQPLAGTIRQHDTNVEPKKKKKEKKNTKRKRAKLCKGRTKNKTRKITRLAAGSQTTSELGQG